MYPKHSSRQQKVPKLRSPISPKDEDNVQSRTSGRKRQGNPKDDNDDGVRCILDLINSSDSFKNEDRGENTEVTTKNKQQSEKSRLRGRKHEQGDGWFHTHPEDFINCSRSLHRHVKKAGGEPVEVTSDELDDFNDDALDDGASGCSSIHSGPSYLSPQKHRISQFLCRNCNKLYQKAKRAKAPIKDKLLDNDPKSLTCDQWVLLKKWKPGRLTHCKGLLARLPLHKQVSEEEEDLAGCLRAHPFLQRNLRLVKMPPGKRLNGNKRKRSRLDSYSQQAAKQQRLQHDSIDGKDDVMVEVMDTSSTSIQQKPKKKSGFREQLLLLRGSTIVREMQ